MASLEIRRGEFVYHDTLFVDVGSGKRHPRASASDLKDLLLPKQGKTPAKDQVAHWYEAQLIHYGLQRTKDKNTAKVRLTAAISAKSLVVPPHVSQMEADMKKEYASAQRKLKATQAKTNAAPKSKKRPAEDDPADHAPTLSFKANGIEFSYSPGNAPSSKKPKKEPTSTKAASKASKSPARPRIAEDSAPVRPKQTARRSRPFNYPSTSSRPPPESPQSIYDHTPSSFSNHDTSAYSDSYDDDPPPAYDSLPFSQSSPAHSRKHGVVQISGTYSLSATGVKTRKAHHPCELSFSLHHESDTLWGTFRIGPKRGLMRISPTSGLASGETKTLGWRAEDLYQNNMMKFGKGCDGRITFDGQGGVSGVMFGVMYGGDVEFEGGLQDAEERPDAAYVREEWDSYPDRAYGRV
jgi:hypothetical protein